MMWSREFARKFAYFTIKGAAATLGGTTISCVLAVYIEGAANRTLFRYFPQWYARLDYVPFGLDPHVVESVQQHYRYQQKQQQRLQAKATTAIESLHFNAEAASTTLSFDADETMDSFDYFSSSLPQSQPDESATSSSWAQIWENGKQQAKDDSLRWNDEKSSVSRQNIMACALTG